MTDRGMRFSALVVAVSSSFITPFMEERVNVAASFFFRATVRATSPTLTGTRDDTSGSPHR